MTYFRQCREGACENAASPNCFDDKRQALCRRHYTQFIKKSVREKLAARDVEDDGWCTEYESSKDGHRITRDGSEWCRMTIAPTSARWSSPIVEAVVAQHKELEKIVDRVLLQETTVEDLDEWANQLGRDIAATPSDTFPADLEDDLQRCLEKEPDWNGYGAIPPNQRAVDRARVMLQTLLDAGIDEALLQITPDVDGGMAIYVFRTKLEYAWISVDNDLEVGALYSSKDGRSEARDVDFSKRTQLAQEIVEFLK